jgi:hypothetical protein
MRGRESAVSLKGRDVTEPHYVYSLEFLREGRPVASVRVMPDFAPVVEAARWAALRQGAPPAEALLAPARIEPRWNDTLGQPYATGLVASAVIGSRSAGTVHVPQRYFGDCARAATASLVEQGLVTAGESLAYLVAAYASAAVSDAAGAASDEEVHIEDLPAALPVRRHRTARVSKATSRSSCRERCWTRPWRSWRAIRMSRPADS